MFEGLLGKLATVLLGSIANVFLSQGANMLFAPRQPSRRDVQQDIQMQRQAAEPIRTPEQVQVDQMAVEANRQRAATFANLSKEYAGLQARGPIYDPATETRIKQEAMADAAVRGMGESGQAQELVNRRMQEYRLGRSSAHAQELGNLRTQMQPYSQIQSAGQPQIFRPQITSQPRSLAPPFSVAPFDVVSALKPDPSTNPLPPNKKTIDLARPYFDIGQQGL